MRHTTLLAIICIVTFSQCEETIPDPSNHRLGDTVTVHLGDTVEVGSVPYRVSFDALLSDSRCPLDAVCVWGGEVKTQVSISNRSNAMTMVLGFYEPWKVPRDTFEQVTIELLGVLPHPVLQSDSLNTTNKSIQIIINPLDQ
ncbi:MAG: hypothetical protein JXR10_17190 [Cyclobacteriaceae bacterium]